MKMSELREKDTGSLVAMEKELAESLFTARLQHKTGQLENTAKISLTRKDLARIKTVLRARELGLEVVEGGKTEKTAKPNHDGKTQVAKAAPAQTGKDSKKKTAAKPAAKSAKPAAKSAAKAKAKPAGKSAKASGKSGKKK